MENDHAQRPYRRTIVAAKVAVRVMILALVGWGIATTISQAAGEFRQRRFHWQDISFGWLAVASGLYGLGMVPSWLFWHRVLWAMGQRPRLRESARAFFIGQLGKYVPGKALVVILRAGLIRSPRTDTAVAATSVFVETLTMMAVGALVAAAILPTLPAAAAHPWLLWLAVGLLAVAGAPTLPPVSRRIVRWIGVRRASPQIEAAIGHLDYRLLSTGWVMIALGWMLIGLSECATLKALAGLEGMPPAVLQPLTHWPLLTAAVSLAMVAGFLSLIPGGLGVRELVLMTLLSDVLGPVAAILSAALLRLTWLVAELVLAGSLYAGAAGVDRRQPDGSPNPPEAAG